MTKVLKMSSIIDDTYDAYGTLDELAPFTDAIQRWDITAIEPYLRPAYEALLDVYSEMEQVLTKECKSDRVYYAKQEMKNLASAYFKEAQWSDGGCIPKCEEHLENALAEQERGHVASIIECYMKEYGASKQEAYMKYHKEVING
uniref:Sesquiterpene synthase 1 n=1 Tax=Solanum tuberosum TaxID=4113 RepID=M1CUL6_SOLTU